MKSSNTGLIMCFGCGKYNLKNQEILFCDSCNNEAYNKIKDETIKSGYLILFGIPTSHGDIYMEGCIPYDYLNSLKLKGKIIDYTIDEKGVKVESGSLLK